MDMLTQHLLPDEDLQPQPSPNPSGKIWRMLGLQDSGDKSPCRACLAGACEKVCRLSKLWWRTTTDRPFLESTISRRAAWKWVVPFFSTANLFTDMMGCLSGSADLSFLVTDVPFFLATYYFAWYGYPIGTIFTDVVLGGFIAVACYWQQQQVVLHNDAVSDSAAGVFGAVVFLEVSIILTILGVHSIIAILLFLLCCLSMLNTPMLLGDKIQIVMTTAVTSLGSGLLEFCIAFAFKEWQSESECNRRLVDLATDGFGVVDGATGVLLHVSPKMAETVGCEEKVLGQRLDTFIDPRDVAALQQFYGSRCSNGEVQPPQAVLVTCISSAYFFEVRLVPYKLHEDSTNIGFCVQLVGEKRSAEQSVPRDANRQPREADPPPHLDVRERRGGGNLDVEEGAGAADAAGCVAAGQTIQDLQESSGAVEVIDKDIAALTDVEDTESQVLQLMPQSAARSEDGAKLVAMRLAGPSAAGPPPPPLLGVLPEVKVLDESCLPDNASLTLSLSSFTPSGVATSSAAAAAGGGGADRRARLPAVETRTIAVQVGGAAAWRDKRKPPKPPDPLLANKLAGACAAAASTSSRTKQHSSYMKVKLRLPPARVQESRSAFTEDFVPTPKYTRRNALNDLVLSCNVSGSGCCFKHIAYMAVFDEVMEQLNARCSDLTLKSDWQCPHCYALNRFEDAEPWSGKEPGSVSDEICMTCAMLVEDIRHDWQGVQKSPTARSLKSLGSAEGDVSGS
mmetsp:Transcript_23397/g.54413  ORF Transcript_23397/g.54413 Transcript_23397/m.54413 type:complete len:736 (-) Transcript_23397:204-2411(-)